MHEADRQGGDTPGGPDAGLHDGAPGARRDSPTIEPPPPVQEVRLHDIDYDADEGTSRPVEWMFSFLVVGAGVGIACAVMLLVVGVDSSFAFIFAIVVGLLAAIASFMWLRARFFATVLEEQTSDDPASVMSALVARRSLYEPERAVPKVVQRLVGRGVVGHALRLHGKGFDAKVTPIPARFEPIPLDALNATCAALAGDGADTSASPLPDARTAPESSSVGGWRYFSYHFQKSGGWPASLTVFLFWIMAIENAVRVRSVTLGLMFWTLLVALRLFGPMVVAPGSGEEWYLVPGGLLVRKPAKGRAGWDLHVFKAKESILCAFQLSKHRWGLAVADAAGCEQCVGVASEAHVALRAWLSPQEPPGVEMLTDLQ